MTTDSKGTYELLKKQILSHAGRVSDTFVRDLVYRLIYAVYGHLVKTVRSLPSPSHDKSSQCIKPMLCEAFSGIASTDEQVRGLTILAGLERTLDVYGPRWMAKLCDPCLTIINESKTDEPCASTIANAVIDIYAVTVPLPSRPKHDGHYLYSAWEMTVEAAILEARIQGVSAVAAAILDLEEHIFVLREGKKTKTGE